MQVTSFQRRTTEREHFAPKSSTKSTADPRILVPQVFGKSKPITQNHPKSPKTNVALIVATYPGKDGRMRKARIKIADGEYDRPIHKLCLIATADELANNKEDTGAMYFEPSKTFSTGVNIIIRTLI